MLKRTKYPLFIFSLLSVLSTSVFSQPTWTIDPFGKEKKPEKFENRKLGSEKTAEKKFTVPRNIYQNNVTHFNYYFNANNRVNAVLDRARLSLKDDYSNILAFYPYTLESTSSQKTELDSVIYTSTAGILLHDLRNDWIDNMYMLIGKAYYFRKDFDSALMTFQFINYNLFPRKRKNDDDDRIVGSNTTSIANKEKRNILQKLTALPPSRNDAIIWLARTLIEQNEFAESGGLINTLQGDPNLPKRLRNDLAEVNAYWFFKQGNYDSTANYLEKALSNTSNKQDQARWEFLLAQLYERKGQYDKASAYYDKASKHTVDPLMEIHARLNDAKMLKSSNPKEMDKAISNLSKMGRRDKYDGYRDIVYFSAGDLSLQKPDTNAAIAFYLKSLKYNENNINYRNRAFLQLGDIAYSRKQYRLAAAMYDSLQIGSDSIIDKRIAKLQDRKAALVKIANAITAIEREDSLQRIALMPAAEREDFVRKTVRKLRKEKGFKEEPNAGGGEIIPFGNMNNNPPADLFASSNTKGEWYFNNNAMKARGFSEFKSKWGNRNNLDNWRRKAAVETVITNPTPTQQGGVGDNKPGNAGTVKAGSNAAGATEISYDGLMKDLPLTDEKMTESNETIAVNMFELAKAYQEDLEEYQLAADTYEAYLKRFPARLMDGEVYLNLYFCYTKLGDKNKAAQYKDMLNGQFANSKSNKKLTNPSALDPKAKNPEVTKLYDDIYNLFIEGDFNKAMAEKKKADALYGNNYWTPQLLYIEALNHVKNRDDSAAIQGLQAIISNDPNSPLKDKAETMINVLRRRAEIEKYLTELEVTRAQETQLQAPNMPVPPPVAKPVAPPVQKDTVAKVVAPLSNGQFVMAVNSPHHVLMVLDKVDQIYVTEARNAFTRYNKENYYGQTININKDQLDNERSLLVITSFPDAAAAMAYYAKIKKDAASEISWLPANKYSFLIITEENLQLLKTNKNLAGYKTLLNTQFPNRF